KESKGNYQILHTLRVILVVALVSLWGNQQYWCLRQYSCNPVVVLSILWRMAEDNKSLEKPWKHRGRPRNSDLSSIRSL
ncbi:hypothetical protein GIB67_012831, partial [Kingdonia uniflora]